MFNPFRALWDASFLYPFKGLVYFAIHPSFWPLFSARLLVMLLLSTFVLGLLFIFAWLPQVAFLFIFQGHVAWFNGTVLVLGEGAAITALLFEAFFVDETLVDVFDAVLIKEGFIDLVGQARLLHREADTEPKMLGKPTISAVYSPFSLRQIIEFVVLLPLNLIPVAGAPLFIVLTGYRAGPFHHWRYFKLLGLTKKERKSFIKKRKLRYTWFGASALVLQLVPVLSMFFLLTSAAGSGLWAAQMERTRRTREALNEEHEDAYHDDPA